VGRLVVVDDTPIESHVLTLVQGVGSDDNGDFLIDGNALKIKQNVALDHDADSELNVRVRVQDGNYTLERAFSIVVTSQNEAPTDIILFNHAIDENRDTNTGAVTVGELSAADDSQPGELTYALVDGDGAGDNDDLQIVQNRLEIRSGIDLNRETKPSYSVRVRVSDQEGLSYEEAFVVEVTDVNEAPTRITVPTTVPEDTSGTVGVIGAVDDDANDEATFELVSDTGDNDNAAFRINENRLEIRPGVVLDHEEKDQYFVRIRATDQGGLVLEQPFVLNVTNVNERPTRITLSNAVVPTNTDTTNPVLVGLLQAEDQDQNDTATFALVRGAGDGDNGSFQITDNRLEIKPGVELNYDEKNQYSVRIRATDQDGLVFEDQFVVTIQSPWQNRDNPMDVNKSGGPADALDVLLIINHINGAEDEKLPAPARPSDVNVYVDVNGDGLCTPLDVLLLINDINSQAGAQGEGEITVVEPTSEANASELTEVPGSVADLLSLQQLLWAPLSFELNHVVADRPHHLMRTVLSELTVGSSPTNSDDGRVVTSPAFEPRRTTFDRRDVGGKFLGERSDSVDWDDILGILADVGTRSSEHQSLDSLFARMGNGAVQSELGK